MLSTFLSSAGPNSIALLSKDVLDYLISNLVSINLTATIRRALSREACPWVSDLVRLKTSILSYRDNVGLDKEHFELTIVNIFLPISFNISLRRLLLK